MIVGEHCRKGNLEVNTTREKKRTNMRAAMADGFEIRKDELIEVTPTVTCLHKRYLTPHERQRHALRQ